jgi:hypothetical protein
VLKRTEGADDFRLMLNSKATDVYHATERLR